MSQECTVYRCARQTEMYLYLRADLKPEGLPEGLRKITGALTEVMKLDLSGERKLARVDKAKVIEAMTTPGYFLQMPPDGHIKAHLHFGD
jgi:uncharacterized protein YcgL (UPF0745 family)